MPKGKEPLTKAEFDGWAGEIKESFSRVEERLDAIEHKLEPLERIAASLQRIEENTTAMLGLYRRLDYRDHVFADKLGIDLRKVDAKFVPPS